MTKYYICNKNEFIVKVNYLHSRDHCTAFEKKNRPVSASDILPPWHTAAMMKTFALKTPLYP